MRRAFDGPARAGTVVQNDSPGYALRMLNALTFDVEEYFHAESLAGVVRREDWTLLHSRVAESTRRLLDLLEERHVKATFFILGWVAEREPRLVREIQGRKHEVACHGFGHRLIYGMNREAFRADVCRAKQAIEEATGAAVAGFRAPTFSIVRETLWALDVLLETGFRYDSSIFPIRHDRYGIPDAPRFPYRIAAPGGGDLVEFPITTLVVGGQHLPFSGGGYFRLAPYPMIRAALRSVNRRDGKPGIVYLHPWELDPKQPRLPVRGFSRFRHYVNLAQTGRKLERLLRDFRFAPAGHVLREQGFAEVWA